MKTKNETVGQVLFLGCLVLFVVLMTGEAWGIRKSRNDKS